MNQSNQSRMKQTYNHPSISGASKGNERDSHTNQYQAAS